MKWLLITMAIAAALLFLFAAYKIDQLARVTSCLYIPHTQQQVNEEGCK